MIRPSRRLAKNAKFLPSIFALLFSLMLYTMMPDAYAANINTSRLAPAVTAQSHAAITSESAVTGQAMKLPVQEAHLNKYNAQLKYRLLSLQGM